MELAFQIYKATSGFPAEEKFGIVSQMRRAVISFPANIAEGQARRTTGEFQQFLGIARGSLAELETFILLSGRFGYLAPQESGYLMDLCAEANKMLHGLMSALRKRQCGS